MSVCRTWKDSGERGRARGGWCGGDGGFLVKKICRGMGVLVESQTVGWGGEFSLGVGFM